VSVLLFALQPANRLVCEVILQTGWRVDDVLMLKSEAIKKTVITITEQKTGKTSTKEITEDLLFRLQEQAGRLYVFEGRDDFRKHRSRQAVYLDLKRAAKRFNLKMNLAPHSLRKNYAVYLKQNGATFEDIRHELNHQNLITTMIYAMSDELTTKYK
jgi:site-specific recombinase XerD